MIDSQAATLTGETPDGDMPEALDGKGPDSNF
jgi:hypothetical protein